MFGYVLFFGVSLELLYFTPGFIFASAHDILPISCSQNITQMDLGAINCLDAVPRDVNGLLSSEQVSIHKIWNKGRWIQVNGFACLKVKITATCYENFFGMTDTTSAQDIMVATDSECRAHLRKYMISSRNPQTEIKYTCHWMKTESTEMYFHYIQPVSVMYDILRSSYTFPGDTSNSTVCLTPPCLMPDFNSLWFPEHNQIDSCSLLSESTLYWSGHVSGYPAFNSYSLHAASLEGSCRVSFCNLKGLLLKSGEWISEEELPNQMLSSVGNLRHCGDTSKVEFNRDSDIKPRHNYNKIAAQIMYNSCQQVKVNVQNTQYPFYPSSLQSISPKKEGSHPGYFVFNRTLFSSSCTYSAVQRSGEMKVNDNRGLYLGKTLDNQTDLFYTGPSIEFKDVQIGPNGLLWVNRTLFLTNHAFEKSLLQNVDLEPQYLSSSLAATITPFSPYNHTRLAQFSLVDDITTVTTIITGYTMRKLLSATTLLLLLILYLYYRFRKSTRYQQDAADHHEHSVSRPEPDHHPEENPGKLVVVDERGRKFVEFLMSKD